MNHFLTGQISGLTLPGRDDKGSALEGKAFCSKTKSIYNKNTRTYTSVARSLLTDSTSEL